MREVREFGTERLLGECDVEVPLYSVDISIECGGKRTSKRDSKDGVNIDETSRSRRYCRLSSASHLRLLAIHTRVYCSPITLSKVSEPHT